MKLLIATPSAVIADYADIAAVRAEDESGEFGILPHHADFVTALSVSVVGWRRAGGQQGYCAVRGGLLTVSGGEDVAIATREAILGDDLASLEAVVRGKLAAEAEEERQARSHAEQFRIQAIRQIIGYLRPQASDGGGGGA
jgi:F-type H+-transporting ATPase subunit epsilon